MPEPQREFTRSEWLADLTTHAGYGVLFEDIFEAIIKEEETKLFNSVKGPQARIYQLEVVTYMKAYLEKAKNMIKNTIITAQQKGTEDVQKTQRRGRR